MLWRHINAFRAVAHTSLRWHLDSTLPGSRCIKTLAAHGPDGLEMAAVGTSIVSTLNYRLRLTCLRTLPRTRRAHAHLHSSPIAVTCILSQVHRYTEARSGIPDVGRTKSSFCPFVDVCILSQVHRGRRRIASPFLSVTYGKLLCASTVDVCFFVVALGS
jgi:hypothetical protein